MVQQKPPFEVDSRVDAYFRDSGGDEQELSVARQEAEFLRWCAAHGYRPGRVFKDEARVGSTTVGRDKFHEMMAYFRSGKADSAGLVIWNYQRFARDVDDSQFYRADLRRRGYVFASMNDVIPEGPMGRFIEAALDWKNEQFLLDLSVDVKSGLRHLVEKYGAVPGYPPPRGFKREPIHISDHRDGRPRIVHRWVPDPEVVPRVRQAFEMLLAGATLGEITRATGLYRSVNCWRTFFSNRLYIGVLDYGDMTIEGYCEPLVDRSVWDAVQAKLAARGGAKHMTGDNPQHPRRNGAVYCLTGLIYCARCGAPMNGMTSGARNGVVNERYVCSRRTRRRDCDAEGIPREFLERQVIDAVRDYLLDPENLLQGQTAILSETAEQAAQIEQQRETLRARLAGLRRRIDNLNQALAEADAAPRSTMKTIAALEQEETGLIRDLAELDAVPAPQVLPLAEIARRAARLRDELATDNQRDLHMALRDMLHRVVVERDGATVRLSITYYCPPKDGEPPPDVSMVRARLGAPVHTRTYLITVTLTRKPRVRKQP